MLKRKVFGQLSAWKADSGRKPVILKGCRQCGKTFAAREFARSHYDNVVYVNFFENPDAKEIFAGSLEVDQLVMMASAYLGSSARFVPGETVFILDEIQECPQARTALKFFHLDGRYDVIGTGSLPGVSGCGETPVSVPVGGQAAYQAVFQIHPPSTGEGEQEVSIFAREEGLYGIAFCGQSSVDRRCRHNAPLQEPFHYRIAA